MTIPERAFYPIDESAVLLGVSEKHLYKQIADGKRANPPADAIAPQYVRRIGGCLRLRREYVFDEAPQAMVTALPPKVNYREMATAIIDEMVGRLSDQGVRRVS